MFIEGDGIGYDIMTASRRIWDAAVEKAYGGQKKIHWMEIYSGEKAAGIYDGDYMPEETFDALREYLVGIKGPLTTPVGGGFRSLNVTLRQVLDLYACIRPVRWYEGVPSPLKEPGDVDVVIFRENTEDVYAGIEFESGTPEAAKIEKFLREEMGATKFFENSGIGIKPISAFGSVSVWYARLFNMPLIVVARVSPSFTKAIFRNLQKVPSVNGVTNWPKKNLVTRSLAGTKLLKIMAAKCPKA